MKFMKALTGRNLIALLFAAMTNASIAQVPMMIAAPSDSDASDAASSVHIVAPADEETIHNNSGNMVVRVETEQPPDTDKTIELSLDGHVVAAQQNSEVFTVSGIDRGAHTLQARSIDKDGTIAQSEPVTFYMWQASVRNRQP